MEELLESLHKIEARLTEIEKILEQNGSKMARHIDFIENIYSMLRRPLEYFLPKRTILPEIKVFITEIKN